MSRKASRTKKQGMVEAGHPALLAPVTLSEQKGIRYLHFGNPWIQGAMRLRKPDVVVLEYGRQMMAWTMFLQEPRQIVQLGLGAGALTKFCHRHFPEANVTAVEFHPEVIHVCRTMFALPAGNEKLQVIEMDAMDYVTARHHEETVDVLQVDLYDSTAWGPTLDSSKFYEGCKRCLKAQGIMTVNLLSEFQSYNRSVKTLIRLFEKVITLPQTEAGNIVVMAFKTRPPMHDLEVMLERARQVRMATGLNLQQRWVRAIHKDLGSTD